MELPGVSLKQCGISRVVICFVLNFSVVKQKNLKFPWDFSKKYVLLVFFLKIAVRYFEIGQSILLQN